MSDYYEEVCRIEGLRDPDGADKDEKDEIGHVIPKGKFVLSVGFDAWQDASWLDLLKLVDWLDSPEGRAVVARARAVAAGQGR